MARELRALLLLGGRHLRPLLGPRESGLRTVAGGKEPAGVAPPAPRSFLGAADRRRGRWAGEELGPRRGGRPRGVSEAGPTRGEDENRKQPTFSFSFPFVVLGLGVLPDYRLMGGSKKSWVPQITDAC